MKQNVNQQRSSSTIAVGGTLRRRGPNWPALLGLVVVLFVTGWVVLTPPQPPPVDAMMASTGWADERRCIDCHRQAEEFSATGHANTLCRADRPDVAELLLTLSQAPEAKAEGLRIEVQSGKLVAIHSANDGQQTAELDWCFGSGHHARTWLGLMDDSWGATDAVEFRWTWYAHGERFGLTPGQPREKNPGYFAGLGVLYDYPKTRRCFGCHATRVASESGRLDVEALLPGVQCQRCHGPRAKHLETEAESPDWSWRGIDQHESVHRCAECHRGSTEQKPEDVRKDNVDIARFQPVGLVQAPCFQKSVEMTCITCHDPHRPMSVQDSLGDWQCTQCHDGRTEHSPHCRAGFRDDCLKCHMPKVQWSETLQFTDHWIRVRDPDKGQP